MTHAGNEPAPLWLKMVPKADPNADGFWTRRLVPDHFCAGRSRTPDGGAAAECPETGWMGTWDAESQRVVPADPRQRLLAELAHDGL